MKMDLGLESLQNDEVCDAVDFESAALDLLEAEHELNELEHDCDELIRGYENLEAVKDVITKYGYTDTLKDLFGEQINSDVLSVSTEGVLDKITTAAKNVKQAFVAAIKKTCNLFNFYIKRFKAAKEWLKTNGDKKTSTESIQLPPSVHSVDIDNTDYIPIRYYVSLLAKPNEFALKSITPAGIRSELANRYRNFFSVTKADARQLANACDEAIENLPKLNQALNDASDELKDLKEGKQYYQNVIKNESSKSHDDVRSAAKSADAIKDSELQLDAITRRRRREVLYKATAMAALNECKRLDMELKRRGFKSEFKI
jgi:hypothetical protein